MKFIIFPTKSELKIPNSLTKFPFIHDQHNNEKLKTKKQYSSSHSAQLFLLPVTFLSDT